MRGSGLPFKQVLEVIRRGITDPVHPMNAKEDSSRVINPNCATTSDKHGDWSSEKVALIAAETRCLAVTKS